MGHFSRARVSIPTLPVRRVDATLWACLERVSALWGSPSLQPSPIVGSEPMPMLLERIVALRGPEDVILDLRTWPELAERLEALSPRSLPDPFRLWVEQFTRIWALDRWTAPATWTSSSPKNSDPEDWPPIEPDQVLGAVVAGFPFEIRAWIAPGTSRGNARPQSV